MSVNQQPSRDHRDLNTDLPVFATDPLAGAGLPLWLPDGAVIREELQRLAKDLARADGCESVYSPVLGKRALFERSGHWAKFSDDMFPPMPVGGDELVLRPANCLTRSPTRWAARCGRRCAPRRSSGSRWTTYGSRGAMTAPSIWALPSSGQPRRRHSGRPPRRPTSPIEA